MITTICEQLLWDWKNSKSRHTIICTTKPANSLQSLSRKPSVPKYINFTDTCVIIIIIRCCDKLRLHFLLCPLASFILHKLMVVLISDSNWPLCRKFLEVLKDREQIEYFRHYLLMNGVNAEALLEFWIAVEDLKHTMGNKKLFKSKLRKIKERFLTGNLQQCMLRSIAAKVACTSM